MRRTSEILSESKRLFGGELDREKLAELLLSHRPLGNIRWLEVGLGDGNNLQYLLDIVCRDVELSVTAIDPQLTVGELVSDRGFDLIRSSFQGFFPAGQYDIINTRHSIYYFGDEQGQIDRFPSMLSSRGRLAITAWTEDCVLYALHHAIAEQIGGTPSSLTAAKTDRSLTEAGLQRIAQHVAIGDVSAKDATLEQLASIVELAARNIDVSSISTQERADVARHFFSACRDLRRHTSVSLYARTSQSS